jgi:two-component system, chemotaxis family, response regulator PixG
MSSGILNQLKFCQDKRFTGKLCATNLNGDTVDTLEGHCWNIYFYRGRLLGDSAGIHPLRRLRRQFSAQRIDLPTSIENDTLKSLSLNHLSFQIISNLLRDRHLDREQAEDVLAGSLVEVLFDILHYETISQAVNGSQLSYILEKDFLQDASVPVILMKTEKIWGQALQQFQSWEANGLIKYPPHLSPQINNISVLQELLPAITFEKIISLIAENRTLRDLAIKIDEEIIVVAKSLVELCNKNALVLRHTNDIDLIDKRISTEIDNDGVSGFLIHGTEIPAVFSKKLIIHLTENSLETSAVQNFVEKAGHQYVNLQESTQALLIFLKCNPDLIVMDNSSVNINAQSLCEQLRRTSKFKTTPIVVLNQNQESMIERLLSNSIEYVTKPLSQQKIFSMINKHLVRQAS